MVKKKAEVTLKSFHYTDWLLEDIIFLCTNTNELGQFHNSIDICN